MATFHTRYPEVSVTLRSGGSDLLIDAVRDRKLDVAIVGSNLPSTAGRLTFTELFVEPLVAVLPAGHDIGRRGRGAPRSTGVAAVHRFPPGLRPAPRNRPRIRQRPATGGVRSDPGRRGNPFRQKGSRGRAVAGVGRASRGWAKIRRSCCARSPECDLYRQVNLVAPTRRCDRRPRRHSSAASTTTSIAPLSVLKPRARSWGVRRRRRSGWLR